MAQCLVQITQRLFGRGTQLKIIVGLGNPTSQYAQTRHNVGWLVLDALQQQLGGQWLRTPKAELLEARIGSEKVVLLKPQTYMNLSGEAVAPLMRFYKLELSDLLVIQDDLDSPFGILRLRKGGRSGGQNGIKSILQHLGTEDFARLKMGISRPPAQWNVSDWVLSKWHENENEMLKRLLKIAQEAAHQWVLEGLLSTQQKFNGTDLRPKPPPPPRAESKLEPEEKEVSLEKSLIESVVERVAEVGSLEG